MPVVALPFFVACEDGNNTSSSGGFTVPEGGSFEAGPPSEAGPVAEGGTDASIDTFVPPKGAKVTVTKNGAAAADIRVIAHDATGAVTGDVKTNATGVANFATAPSMITVLTRSYGTSPHKYGTSIPRCLRHKTTAHQKKDRYFLGIEKFESIPLIIPEAHVRK